MQVLVQNEKLARNRVELYSVQETCKKKLA